MDLTLNMKHKNPCIFADKSQLNEANDNANI